MALLQKNRFRVEFIHCFYIWLATLIGKTVAAADSFEERRNVYINSFLQSSLSNSNSNTDVITVQAYTNGTVKKELLDSILSTITTKSTVDFDIVKLIRVLFLSKGQYDTTILTALKNIPFWLQKNEILREYWSENHMILWMSSDWLLYEKYNRPVDDTLKKRLLHYLQVKNKYGYYEFFSSTYLPYTLSALLNLIDFTTDSEIQKLAVSAAQRLVKDLLSITNDQGVFYPAAGRNVPVKYRAPYGQNHNHLIYLLTGLGEIPTGISHAGGMLASTSKFNVDEVVQLYYKKNDMLNMTFTLGHSLQDGINTINKDMSQKDKVIFQWSSGAYFHPDVAKSTFKLIKDMNLWDHSQFNEFKSLKFLPTSMAVIVAKIGDAISKSSGLYNPTISVFKYKSITLSSLQEYWKGYLGYQQFPVVANTGKNAVFTLSGTPSTDWDKRPSNRNMNSHLPYVKQRDNVALVMYRPEPDLQIYGYTGEELYVSMYWPTNSFNEQRETGNWILGREGESYVAVRRYCVGVINGVPACAGHSPSNGQTWVFIVGNKDMYSTFDKFEQIIKGSKFTEQWYVKSGEARIVIDGKTIEYSWKA